MLALGESDGNRNSDNKKQKGGQKRLKHESKSQKRIFLISDDKGSESKVDAITEDELKIHDLLPVQYKSDEHDLSRVTFETDTVSDDQVSQAVVPINCIDSVHNSNKFVIITLLESSDLNIPGEATILNAEDVIDGGEKLRGNRKIQKKLLLLHKIDPIEATTQALEASAETVAHVLKDDSSELIAINFDDSGASGSECDKESRDIGNWIKKFQSLPLLYTDSGKPYIKCPACTAMFFKTSSFEKHIASHIQKENQRYICSFCKYFTSDPSTIFTHLYMHQDQCEVCNMNLTRKNSFKKHWELSEMFMTFTIKRDRWGRFVCIYCKLGFDLSHQLQKHWFKHSCNAKKTYQCNSCSGLFETSGALSNHVCLKCPVCGKVCDSVHRLRSHTRYEKHYLYCEICLYEFILAVDHEKHMDLHKKPYHCHKDYNHCLESEDGTSFQCEICGKIYHSMSCLLLHIHDDHKIPDANRTIIGELERISEPEDKAGPSYEIIHSLKEDLKCGEMHRTCEQVLNNQEEVFEQIANPDNLNNCKNSEPIALCWNRYSTHEGDGEEKQS